MDKGWLKISGMHDGATPEIFKNASKLRLDMTETERILWDYLKIKPLGFKFRRQHPIKMYILDFYCHSIRLSIEIDGGYHLKAEQKLKDLERTAYLKSVGIKEMRFTNNEVKNNFRNVISEINKELCADIPLGIEGEPRNKL